MAANERDNEENATFSLNVFASEGNKYQIDDTFHVPEGYYEDKLIVMPSSADKLYVYWEITPELVAVGNPECVFCWNNIGPAPLVLKIFEFKDGGVTEFYSDGIQCRNGSGHLQYKHGFNPMVAVIGFYEGLEFCDILLSRTIYYPAYRFNLRKDDFWMKRIKEAASMKRLSDNVAASLEMAKKIAMEMGLPPAPETSSEAQPPQMQPQAAQPIRSSGWSSGMLVKNGIHTTSSVASSETFYTGTETNGTGRGRLS
ncbi:MAG: hypothetical protein HQK89_01800 [Nitrospirae bacterium]|nr:hypothetical protein [Nitrospirota bacterium]